MLDFLCGMAKVRNTVASAHFPHELPQKDRHVTQGREYFCSPMKRFLFPVDFSADSRNAFEYGLQLAKGLRVGSVVLVHAVKVNAPAGGSSPLDTLEEWAQSARQVLGAGVAVEARVVQGKPEDVIEKQAFELEADLIVMGALGADSSAQSGNFLGNLSGTMFKHTELPMLFVPADCHWVEPRKMAFILKSLMIYKPDALKPLMDIAKAWSSEISIVQIKAATMEETYGRESNMSLDGAECSVYQLSCTNVPSGIARVTDIFDPQILCVIRRKRDFFESLFKARAISASDFNSTVPVLVLQGLR